MNLQCKDLETFQFTFINAEAKLPGYDIKDCICISENGILSILDYNAKWKAFNATDESKDHEIKVIAYAIPTKEFKKFLEALKENKKFIKV